METLATNITVKPLVHTDILKYLTAIYDFIRTYNTSNISFVDEGTKLLKSLDYSIKTKEDFKKETHDTHGPARMAMFNENFCGEEYCHQLYIRIFHDDAVNWKKAAHNTEYEFEFKDKNTHDILFPGNPDYDADVIDFIATAVYQETEFQNFKLDPITGLASPVISPKNTTAAPYDSLAHRYAPDQDISNITRRVDFKGHVWSTTKLDATHKAHYILQLDKNGDLHCYDVWSDSAGAVEKRISITEGVSAKEWLTEYLKLVKIHGFLKHYSWEMIEKAITKYKENNK